jgi:hypothetical protein
VRRIFWVVRHAQREDNKKEFGTCLEKGKIVFLKDNSPLSEEGKLMASKMAPMYEQSIYTFFGFCYITKIKENVWIFDNYQNISKSSFLD